MVTDLIKATPESDVLRRDIYDRPPIFRWTIGRVALLGDSAHAMQPNLGQGGCMAIEDGYQLAKDLGEAEASCSSSGRQFDPTPTLQARAPALSAGPEAFCVHGMPLGLSQRDAGACRMSAERAW